MPGEDPQPFCYSVQSGGELIPFVYIVQQGQTTVSLAGLVFQNGAWKEQPTPSDPIPGSTTMQVEPFGPAGTLVTSVRQTDGGIRLTLVLAFETAVDFTKPLPLEQLSLKDCRYTVWAGYPPGNTVYPVQSVARVNRQEPVPFYYSARTADRSAAFIYIVQQARTIVSMADLIFEDGAWTEPYPFATQMTVAPFGQGGTLITASSEGIAAGAGTGLVLAFGTAVDFTEPLPLEQLSLKDCLFSEWIGQNTTNYPVLAVTCDPPGPAQAPTTPSSP
jgi:hypothetical protein